MATLIPCIKGKFGNTEYYEAKMNAREFIQSVRIAKDLDEWTSMNISERIQREPNLKRIKEEIAPYLAENEDRFFGSIILLIYKEGSFGWTA